MAKKYKPHELYIERILNAPVKMVWDAWIDPEQVKKWWGPRGFTITTKSKDVRPGGKWIYTMHSAEGVDFPNVTHFLEVIPLKKLVYDHGANENQPPMFRVTVNFIDLGAKTKMEMWMALSSEQEAKNIKQFIKKANGDSTWDRLCEYLEMENTKKDIFVINRTFHAPKELLFDCWTDPKHLAKWLAPTGTEMTIISGELKVGSTLFYKMTNGSDMTLYGKTQYLEIVRPERLVYRQNFADQDGNLGKHPFAPTWPTYMLTTIEFIAENTDQQQEETRIKVTWEIFGDATPEERKMFFDAKAGMTIGWTGSFDKLEDYLKMAIRY